MTTIYLEPNQVPAHLRGNYTGKKFQVEITDSVRLYNTYWSGGSRNTYTVTSLIDGASKSVGANSTAPQFGPCSDGAKLPVLPGFAVIEHSIFCGKDMGLTFYIHPDNAAKFLPDNTPTLTDAELCLLDATAGLKANYGGRKPRIDMMVKNGFSMADIEAAKQALIDKKMLRPNGSITPLGRNNRPEMGRFYS